MPSLNSSFLLLLCTGRGHMRGNHAISLSCGPWACVSEGRAANRRRTPNWAKANTKSLDMQPTCYAASSTSAETRQHVQAPSTIALNSNNTTHVLLGERTMAAVRVRPIAMRSQYHDSARCHNARCHLARRVVIEVRSHGAYSGAFATTYERQGGSLGFLHLADSSSL